MKYEEAKQKVYQIQQRIKLLKTKKDVTIIEEPYFDVIKHRPKTFPFVPLHLLKKYFMLESAHIKSKGVLRYIINNGKRQIGSTISDMSLIHANFDIISLQEEQDRKMLGAR